MTYQITLSDQEYAALAIAAAKSGTDPEQLLHDMIQRLQTPSQKRSLTAHEILEKQYSEGKISHIPTRQPLTPAEREARERRAQRFAGGKPASQMVIEDRGMPGFVFVSADLGLLSVARAEGLGTENPNNYS